jgi:hypothetical protein
MEPKFALDQQVKFLNDHDRMTGKVISFSWDSENGYTYKISSRYYSVELHDMVNGIKICREEELVDMTSYTGSTTPIKPDKTVEMKEQVNAPATPAQPEK